MAYARVLTVCCLLLLVTTEGCGSLSRELSKTPRTAIEQLLLTQAVERSLADLTIPLPPRETIAVDTLGLTPDQEFLRLALAGRLSELGYRVHQLEDKPTYLARITLQGLGTEQGTSFFGMPPVQSVIIPFSLPEITIYKKVSQQGMVRLSVALYRLETQQLISKTPWYEATTHYNQVVLFLFMSFLQTDLILPQQPLLYE